MRGCLLLLAGLLGVVEVLGCGGAATPAGTEAPRPGDGRIAHVRPTDGYWQVWVMNADGTEARPLTHSPVDKLRVSWFPDGDALLVNTQAGVLLRVRADTGVEEAIDCGVPSVWDAVVSRDGRRIAFTYGPGDSKDDAEIFVVDVGGGPLRQLTDMPALQHQPAWGEDDEAIFFSSGPGGQTHDIFRVSTREVGDPLPVVFGKLYNFQVAVREDGALAYSSNRGGSYDIWVRLPGQASRRFTDGPGLEGAPAWASRGQALVYEASSRGQVDLWWKPLDGGDAIRLTESESGARAPAWRDAP